MSSVRFKLFGKGIATVALCTVSVVTAESCGFPDHQFVSDAEFSARGKAGHSGTGPDAAAGGSAETGGTTSGNGGSGSGGRGTGGATSSGGSDMPMPREGGLPAGGSVGTGGAPDGGDVDSGTPCPPGLDLCGDTCVDQQTNPTHCGDCTTACTSAEVCTSGKCSAPCDTGLTACTATGATTANCVDTKIDETNCGACNQPCVSPAPPAKGKICEGGQCVADCGTLERCGTACIDTTNDNAHCGDCATDCTAKGQVCSGGTCKASCTTPFVACPSGCANLATENGNCGMCGKVCTAPQGCVNSVCKTLVENCLNGTDDDRDGLVDCADPDCNAGYTCGSVPAGWQGPVALWTGNLNGAPACPSSYPAQMFLAHDQLDVPNYDCPSCSCTPKNAGCGAHLNLSFDITPDCTGTAAWTYTMAPKACQAKSQTLFSSDFNPKSLPIRSVQLDVTRAPSPTTGICSPGPVNATLPVPTWKVDAEACGGTSAMGAGCAVGQCLPKPTQPFGGSLCIFRSGVSSCPSSYPVSGASTNGQVYQDFTDGRSCTTCSCGSVSCGNLSLYTQYDVARMVCGGPATSVPMDGNCATIDPPAMVAGTQTEWLTWSNATPACGQGTSALAGVASPADPITVCCER